MTAKEVVNTIIENIVNETMEIQSVGFRVTECNGKITENNDDTKFIGRIKNEALALASNEEFIYDEVYPAVNKFLDENKLGFELVWIKESWEVWGLNHASTMVLEFLVK